MKKVISIALCLAFFGVVGCSSHDSTYVPHKAAFHKKCIKHHGGKFGTEDTCDDTSK